MRREHRFVILEDHPLVREALMQKIVTHLGDINFVYSGKDVFEARTAIAETGADCVIVDLDLGDGRSPSANIAMLNQFDVPILVVSALGGPALIREAFSAGVSGYVSKSADPLEFLLAVSTALRGETYTSQEAAAALLTDASNSAGLSIQEQRALVLYASGMKMRAVGTTMGVSEGTAREYIKRVRAKYERAGKRLPTKTDLYRTAREEGLIP